MNILSTNKLTIGYDKHPLIKDISMELASGQIVTLIGPNGSGKTTLLKTIAGLLDNIEGVITLDGKDLARISESDKAKLMSVMLTYKGNYDYATCRDVVSVGRYPYTNMLGKLSAHDIKIIDDTMQLVGVSKLADSDFNKISDGQRQRVLLARALVQEPKVMILDEPTSFLDVGYKLEFMNTLKRLAHSSGIGILMSLHELDLAASISDKIITITRDNKIDRFEEPQKLLTKEYIGDLFGITKGSYSLENGFLIDDVLSGNEVSYEKACTISQNQDTSNAPNKTKFIMVQGTMSSAGKSLVVAALCRIFSQDGYKVAPFKSQNMALNSYITEDGLEMGRAQVMQAEAAKIKPSVYMNPILLKPTDDVGSQVIVNGKVVGNMKARDYFEYKKSLVPEIMKALNKLSEDADIIVIEGAGSPAEINLKENDIVNMGMAKLVNAPVLLVGDIDRGGVFAQLVGTLSLLEDDERSMVKGLIINKFRGDKSILDPGIDMLIKRTRIDVVGVIPYMDINLEDEDSLTERFMRKSSARINITVIRLPHISNFTDFDVFEQLSEVSVRYAAKREELEEADIIIIPGTKNTIGDMKWLRENGLEIAIKKEALKGVPIFGICGGLQILGTHIEDRCNVEGGGSIDGLGLLPVSTIMGSDKCRKQVSGVLPQLAGVLGILSGKSFYGYEIHMGRTQYNDTHDNTEEPIVFNVDNIYGTYVHGFFDHEEISRAVINCLADRKDVYVNVDNMLDYRAYKEQEYDRLASIMRDHIDLKSIYSMIGL